MPKRHPQRDQAIVTLYEAGWTVPMIATLTGLSATTVWRVLHRAGVQPRGRWGKL